MAGFNFSAGRSNNMLAAEAAGMVTIGRWAKRHGVSAKAAESVMRPTEAHHTGTGRRGSTRLTYVIEGSKEPTPEQLEAMRAFDAGARPQIKGAYLRWKATYEQPYGRKRWVPTTALFEGDEVESCRLKDFLKLNDEEFAWAKECPIEHFGRFQEALRERRLKQNC
jgi:hypothetical protein